jgi:hypothetical protein
MGRLRSPADAWMFNECPIFHTISKEIPIGFHLKSPQYSGNTLPRETKEHIDIEAEKPCQHFCETVLLVTVSTDHSPFTSVLNYPRSTPLPLDKGGHFPCRCPNRIKINNFSDIIDLRSIAFGHGNATI